ncbi:hypothetical protein ACOMHN_023164 [Nucella lapillus]
MSHLNPSLAPQTHPTPFPLSGGQSLAVVQNSARTLRLMTEREVQALLALMARHRGALQRAVPTYLCRRGRESDPGVDWGDGPFG